MDSHGALIAIQAGICDETSLARHLMSDEEWAFHERFILAVSAPNGRKPLNHRIDLDGVF
jgi:hypothetical protein